MIIKIHQNSEDSFSSTEYYKTKKKLTKAQLEDLLKQDIRLCKGEIEEISWLGKKWGEEVGMCEILEEIGERVNPEADYTIIIPCYSPAVVVEGDRQGK